MKSTPSPLARRGRSRPPAFVLVARRHLNPDAFPADLADAAAAAEPQLSHLACDTFDDAVATGRAVQRGRTFGYHIETEIVAPDGAVLAHVSPNGRVWAGAAEDRTPRNRELKCAE